MSKKTHNNPLETSAVIINGRYYLIEDMPTDEEISEKGPLAFKKAVAYRRISDLSRILLPYHGVLESPDDFNSGKLDVGIWFVKKSKGRYAMRIVYPRSKTERESYSIDRERNVIAAVLDGQYANDQFIDIKTSAIDTGSDIFIPPLYQDDDPLNTLIKTAIRTKEAPFEPYGNRLEALAVEKKHGVEGVNIRNNAKRAIKLNRTMSPSKALQYADTWQLELAFIVKDHADAMHPMFDSGEMLVIYPNGFAFPIEPDKLIDVSTMIQDGTYQTSDRNDDDVKIQEE